MKKKLILQKIRESLKKDSARLLFLTISGSDLYGFSSKDSDIDLRGVFAYKTSELLGFENLEDVKKFQFGNYDIVLYELKKAIGLVLAGNCTFVENLHSLPIYLSRDFKSLREVLLKTVNRQGLALSYRGMGIHNYKKYLSSVSKTAPVKKFLYVFRGLLCARNILENSEIEPNINRLLERYNYPEIKLLVELKQKGKENGELRNTNTIRRLEELYQELLEMVNIKIKKTSFNPVSKELREEIKKELIAFRTKDLMKKRKGYKSLTRNKEV